MADRPVAPRGRHAPPLEVRLDHQRARLFRAAAIVFSRQGYADASAEAIAREAGMSKATFYEHFDNKEDCICSLFDAAAERIREGLRMVARADRRSRVHASIVAFLEILAANPAEAQTLLVEIVGAGPRAVERRDGIIEDFARYIYQRTAEDAARGTGHELPSLHDAVAIVGGVFELASRQVRTKDPADVRGLEPVVERLVLGVMEAGARRDG